MQKADARTYESSASNDMLTPLSRMDSQVAKYEWPTFSDLRPKMSSVSEFKTLEWDVMEEYHLFKSNRLNRIGKGIAAYV